LACISPDGKPTESGKKLLAAVINPIIPEAVAARTNLPLFRVRSGLRELSEAGYIKVEQEQHVLTDAGREALRKLGMGP